eukprot:gene17655-24001_t
MHLSPTTVQCAQTQNGTWSRPVGSMPRGLKVRSQAKRGPVPLGLQQLTPGPLNYVSLKGLGRAGMVCRAQETGSEAAVEAQDKTLNLLLENLADGAGQAVVVVGVLEDSPADKAGIVAGMKVLAVSDPVKTTDMFMMNERPSLRFVKDALRMRRTLPVEIWLQPNFITAAPELPEPSPQAVQSDNGVLGSLENLVSDSDGSESDDNGITLANNLASRYEETIRQKRLDNEVRQRIERRQAYMAVDDARDDTKLILGLVVAFVGPAFAILAYAASSGFLDNMYLSSLSSFGN